MRSGTGNAGEQSHVNRGTELTTSALSKVYHQGISDASTTGLGHAAVIPQYNAENEPSISHEIVTGWLRDVPEPGKSAQRTVLSPKPEGRKSAEKRRRHRPALVLFLILYTLLLGALPDPSQTREWRDRTGQFRTEAELLGYKDGFLRLHKLNGIILEVPSEKMSLEDMRYVEKIAGRGSSTSRKGGGDDDDDEPLAKRRQSPHTPSVPAKKAPQVDWFEFFLNAGCEVDDCTRYASSFERDKIEEAILPDILEGTLRTLGQRAGDIIRVAKAIDARRPKPRPGPPNLFISPGA